MSSLTLRPASKSMRHCDLFDIVPNRLNCLPIPEILQMPIHVDEQPALLGDHFQVTDGERDTLIFDGDFSRCDGVGGGMTNGRLIVTGSVGDFLAERMRGGTIEVAGSAGRFAASGLQSGLVEIEGDCGQYAASASGTKRGMNGGVLIVSGNCDQWLATRMRRGTVIVHGNVAGGCANRMIAGTLVLCGRVEFPLAANMARGTILLLGRHVVCTAPAGFTDPEHIELSYLRILWHEVAPHLPAPLRDIQIPSTVFRSLGDRVNQGLGEVIWLSLMR